jgi:hypothetical protein
MTVTNTLANDDGINYSSKKFYRTGVWGWKGWKGIKSIWANGLFGEEEEFCKIDTCANVLKKFTTVIFDFL